MTSEIAALLLKAASHGVGIVFAVLVTMSVPCSVRAASEIKWTGAGNTSAWSDGGNWDGGTPPGQGDIAVIPGGKTAGLSSSDLAYITGCELASINLPETDSTLFITNNAASTMTVPVSGIGRFDISNNCNRLEFQADNSAFLGPFMIFNSYTATDRSHPKCFGICNVISNFVGEGTASQYLSYPGEYRNTWWMFGGSASPGSTERSLFTYSDITLSGPVYVDGNYRLSSQQGTLLTLSGGVYHSGMRALVTAGNVKITGDTVCEFNTSTPDYCGLFVQSGTLELDSLVSASTPRVGGPGVIRFCRPNLLSASTGLQEGNVGNAAGMILDLNGFDQRCGTIYKMTLDRSTEENTYITSETDATLTVYGQVELSGNAYRPYRYISLSIRGAASLEMNAGNTSSGVWPEMEIRNCPTKSDTSGALRVRRGTLHLAETTAWPNLSRLEVYGEGKLDMKTDAVNANGFEFIVSNVVDRAVAIESGKCLYAKSAYFDRWLEPGEYGGVDAGLSASRTLKQLDGGGRLMVAELGGPKGIRIVVR